jgi:hypothetical protein
MEDYIACRTGMNGKDWVAREGVHSQRRFVFKVRDDLDVHAIGANDTVIDGCDITCARGCPDQGHNDSHYPHHAFFLMLPISYGNTDVSEFCDAWWNASSSAASDAFHESVIRALGFS